MRGFSVVICEENNTKIYMISFLNLSLIFKLQTSNYYINVLILGRFKMPTLQVELINLCFLFSKQRYILKYIISQCLFQN